MVRNRDQRKNPGIRGVDAKIFSSLPSKFFNNHMTFLYHRAPPKMKGDILYPLNQLKNIDLDLYEQAFSKYKGREHIPQQHIPQLNCLWDDVIHLSAVHPQKIEDALHEVNDTLTLREFFEIDPHLLEPQNTVIYLFKHSSQEDKFLPENWTSYDPDKLKQYSELPEKTLRYYKAGKNRGEQLLKWAYIPHILYKGTINTQKAKRISISS